MAGQTWNGTNMAEPCIHPSIERITTCAIRQEKMAAHLVGMSFMGRWPHSSRFLLKMASRSRTA